MFGTYDHNKRKLRMHSIGCNGLERLSFGKWERMVDPVSVMAGLALLKKTVEVCSGAVDTCENISELGSHLNNLFKHHEQSKQKKEVKKKKIKKNKKSCWHKKSSML